MRVCCRSPTRPFPARPHNSFTSFLDIDPLSQLHRRLPAGDTSSGGCRRSTWEKKYTAHPETAPMNVVAGIIERDGCVLICQRKSGRHALQGGIPGGKV